MLVTLIMSKKQLSVLILSIPERFESFRRLQYDLESQINNFSLKDKVEILSFIDNKSQSIADKRNALLNSAKGNYLAFLDDDDIVSPNYLYEISKVVQSNDIIDCITFEQLCSLDGKPLKVSFGLNNPHESLTLRADNTYKSIRRPPYPMCYWKSSIAKSELFRQVFSDDGQSIEDIDWLLRLYPKCRTEHHINETLHYYIYNSKTTASRNTNLG
jgi:glycosyltransferase involved in cell wall biosynthesis